MKVKYLNLGVPIRVCTTVAPSAAAAATAARAAQQRAKLEELREYIATQEVGWRSSKPSRSPAATATRGVGGNVFQSSQPTAPMTYAELLVRAEQASKELRAKQSQERFTSAMRVVQERYRNSGRAR